MEQVGQQKTRYQVGGSKQAIREQVIGEKERSGGEYCRVRNWLARDWGASDQRASNFGRNGSGND